MRDIFLKSYPIEIVIDDFSHHHALSTNIYGNGNVIHVWNMNYKTSQEIFKIITKICIEKGGQDRLLVNEFNKLHLKVRVVKEDIDLHFNKAKYKHFVQKIYNEFHQNKAIYFDIWCDYDMCTELMRNF